MESFRRQQRKREQQKQKADRGKQRDLQLKSVDSQPLFAELHRLVELDKRGQLQDRPGQIKLRQAKDEVTRLIDKRQKAGMDVSEMQQELQSILRMKVATSDLIAAIDSGDEEYTGTGGNVGKEVNQHGLKRKAGEEYDGQSIQLALSSIPIPSGPSPAASYKPPPLPVEVPMDKFLPPLPVYPPPQLIQQQQLQQHPFYYVPQYFMPPPTIAVPTSSFPPPQPMTAPIVNTTVPNVAQTTPTVIPTEAVVASAAPQIRDLRREATAFVPASVVARQRAKMTGDEKPLSAMATNNDPLVTRKASSVMEIGSMRTSESKITVDMAAKNESAPVFGRLMINLAPDSDADEDSAE